MDNKKKRRSSIKKPSVLMGQLDNPTADATARVKRRISFSGKKSVREFCGEAEPKMWNNSYELSDPVNASGGDATNATDAERSRATTIEPVAESSHILRQHTRRIIPAEDKENVQWYPPNKNADPAVLSRASMSDTASEHVSVTFSIYGDEYHVLQQANLEQTVDYLKETQEACCQWATRKSIATNTRGKRQTLLCKEDMVESISIGNMEQTVGTVAVDAVNNVTVFANERIGAEQQPCGTARSARRLTMRDTEDMQISLIEDACVSNEHSLRASAMNTNRDVTSFSTSMELESPVQGLQKRALSPANDVNMEEVTASFSDKLKVFSLHDNEKPETQSGLLMDMATTFMSVSPKKPEHEEPLVKQPIGTANTEDLPVGDIQRSNAPKVVVMRKVCTPTVKSSATLINFEKTRFQRYQVKCAESAAQPQHAPDRVALAQQHKRNSAFDMSFSSAENMSAYDMSSPLFPAEFIASANKKLNCRQLNDDIEHGKIQIYPELEAQISIVSRKSVGKQLFVEPKESERRAELVLVDMEMDPCAKMAQNASDSASGNAMMRVSEADDLLLDNTSFLVRAKLGDETVSRNSSKCSSLNRRETIHFNADIVAAEEEEQLTSSVNRLNNKDDFFDREAELLGIYEKQAAKFIGAQKDGVVEDEHTKRDCGQKSISERTDLSLNEMDVGNESANFVVEDCAMEPHVNIQNNGSNVREMQAVVQAVEQKEMNLSSKNSPKAQQRQTLYLYNDIETVEVDKVKSYVSVKEEKQEYNKRQTLIFASDMSLDESGMESSKGKHNETAQTKINANGTISEESKKHQTLQISSLAADTNNILDEPMMAGNKEEKNEDVNYPIKKNPTSISKQSNMRQARQTLIFTNDMNGMILDESSMANSSDRLKENSNTAMMKQPDKRSTRQTEIFVTDINNIVNESNENNIKAFDVVKRTLIDTKKEQPKQQKTRDTLIFGSDVNNVPLDESIVEYNSEERNINGPHSSDEISKAYVKKQLDAHKNWQTMIFATGKNNISLDESLAPCSSMHRSESTVLKLNSNMKGSSNVEQEAHTYPTQLPSKPLNAAKAQPKQQKTRDTLIFGSDVNNVPLDESIVEYNSEERNINGPHSSDEISKAYVKKQLDAHKNRQTMIFATGKNNISLDESLAPCSSMHRSESTVLKLNSNMKGSSNVEQEAHTYPTQLPSKPLNAAKAHLMRQDAMCMRNVELDDSLAQKLNETRAVTFSVGKNKTVHFDGSAIEVSPLPDSEQEERMRRIYEGTPHRSVIEFEYLELEAEHEQQRFEAEKQNAKSSNEEVDMSPMLCSMSVENPKKFSLRRFTTHKPTAVELDVSGLKPLENGNVSNIGFVSPVVSIANALKRLTANLTPNLPISKKRQTLVFNDCGLEESIEQNHIAETMEKVDTEMALDTSKQMTAKSVVNAVANRTCLKPEEIDATCEISDVAVVLNLSSSPTAIEQKNIVSSSKSLTKDNTVSANTDVGKTPDKKAVTPGRSNTPGSRIPVLVSSAKRKKSNLTPNKCDESELDQSLETIQVPRKATTFLQQHQNSIKLSTTVDDTTLVAEVVMNESNKQQQQQSAFFAFEDNPITISDVSVHYLKQREKLSGRADSSGDLCTNNTINRLANFERDYINLTRFNSMESDDIEKTRLSLVESLLSENVDYDELDNEDKVCENEEEHQKIVEPVEVAKCAQNWTAKSKGNVSMCRKCRRCQETLTEETMSVPVESFVLPALPGLPNLGLDQLERLRQRPGIADVHEYWRRKSLERSLSPGNISTAGTTVFDIEEMHVEMEEELNDGVIGDMLKELERVETQIKVLNAELPFKARKTFVQRLDEILSKSLANWIFDYQMQHRNVLLFTHMKLYTFIIAIQYKETSPLGESIEIKNIEVQDSRVPKKNWKAIDYFMDFQFRLELPLDLKSSCRGSTENDVFEILQRIDDSCMEVVRTGNYLRRLICSEHAALVRDAGRTIVRKIERIVVNDGECPRVEKSEYKVELTNIKTLCFRNIVAPPLHAFSENVQFLPTGMDFLHAFLRNPTMHLKRAKYAIEQNDLTFVKS